MTKANPRFTMALANENGNISHIGPSCLVENRVQSTYTGTIRVRAIFSMKQSIDFQGCLLTKAGGAVSLINVFD